MVVLSARLVCCKRGEWGEREKGEECCCVHLANDRSGVRRKVKKLVGSRRRGREAGREAGGGGKKVVRGHEEQEPALELRKDRSTAE